MSLIFLTALNAKDFESNGLKNEQLNELWIEVVNEKTYSILWLINITLDGDKVDKWMDTFAWLITNLFAVWIIWFFLFFAVKMTKLWEKIWWWIQDTMHNLMKNLPIIPIPGGGWVWVAAASQWLKWLWDKLSTPMYNQQMKQLREQMPWLYPGGETAEAWWGALLAGVDQQLRNRVIEWFKEWNAEAVFKDLSTAEQEVFGTAAWLSTAYNTYVAENVGSQFSDVGEIIWWAASVEAITTYSAENLTVWTIESNVRSDENWKTWARWVLGWNVKTADWETYVMVNQWTHADPDFKLIGQKEYSEQYLWQTDKGEFNEEEAKANIEDKIKKQYNLWENATSEELAKQQEHIDAQQKEVQDRISLLEKNVESSGPNQENDNSNVSTEDPDVEDSENSNG